MDECEILLFVFLFIKQLLPLLYLFHCVVHYEPLQRAGRENNWRVSRKGFHISTQSSQDVKMDRERERARKSFESVVGEDLASQYEEVPSGPSPSILSSLHLSTHVLLDHAVPHCVIVWTWSSPLPSFFPLLFTALDNAVLRCAKVCSPFVPTSFLPFLGPAIRCRSFYHDLHGAVDCAKKKKQRKTFL